MYCDKCGKEVKKGEKFCTSCGNPVTQVQIDKKVNTKKTKKLVLAVMSIVLVVGIVMSGYAVYNKVIYPKMQYEKAEKLLKEEKYQEALKQFESLADYKDARERVEEVKLEIKYKEAEESLANYQYQEALNKFEELGDYKDAKERVKNFIFQIKKKKTEDGTDTYNYEFDDRGNVKKIRVNKGANNFGIWEFQFNENNLPISYVYTEKENGKVSSEQGETYEYDSSQNLIYSEFTYNGTKRITTVYSYDNNGNKTKRTITEYDENGSKYGEYENTYEYDINQLLLREKDKKMRMDNEDEVSSIENFITYEYDDNGNVMECSWEGTGKGSYVDAYLLSRKYIYENNRLKGCNSFVEKNTTTPEWKGKWEEERNYEYNDEQKTAKWSYSNEDISTWNEGQEIEKIVGNGTYKFDIYGNTIEDTWYKDENGEKTNGKYELTYIATGYGKKEERGMHWNPSDLILKKSSPWYEYDSCTGGTVIYYADKFQLIDFNGIQTWYVK